MCHSGWELAYPATLKAIYFTEISGNQVQKLFETIPKLHQLEALWQSVLTNSIKMNH